ncbi:unnamed protein product [Amoebophrya sp. A25]|nr:unnamed protein product [Amoebophrya sp. A25]|eukprot:GSA25T00015328001.1
MSTTALVLNAPWIRELVRTWQASDEWRTHEMRSTDVREWSTAKDAEVHFLACIEDLIEPPRPAIVAGETAGRPKKSPFLHAYAKEPLQRSSAQSGEIDILQASCTKLVPATLKTTSTGDTSSPESSRPVSFFKVYRWDRMAVQRWMLSRVGPRGEASLAASSVKLETPVIKLETFLEKLLIPLDNLFTESAYRSGLQGGGSSGNYTDVKLLQRNLRRLADRVLRVIAASDSTPPEVGTPAATLKPDAQSDFVSELDAIIDKELDILDSKFFRNPLED